MKRALVTGGSGEIGSAICRQLASDGLEVIVHANQNRDKAEKIVEQIARQGGRASSITFNICDADETRQCIEDLISDQPVQVLVHNAGIVQDAPLAGMSPSQWSEVIDVSLNGFYNVTHPLLLPMMSTRWGRIVSISSVSGIRGNRGQANYAAAKSGLHGASKSLAREVASRGITVNVIAPGIVAGKLTENIFDDDVIKQIIPMKRAAQPDEIAAVAGFISSEACSYMTGQIIAVDGGMS